MERGHQVEWFSSSFPGAPAEQVIAGVRIVRRGRQWTVHWHAFRRYHGHVRADFDVVIDEVNTMPFFTPVWAPIPRFMLIFQLAREVWWYESPFPVSAIGYAVEPIYLRIYRNSKVITISRSTATDLRRLGFTSSIHEMPVGIGPITVLNVEKASEPTFVYVGRLAPSKRLEHMLRALTRYRQGTGGGTLWLIGAGSAGYRRSLESLARKLGIHESVVFLGRLPNEQKHRRMAEAHALLMTSVREGWGLVVTEASACGTPAIVYDVPGLRDSVRNGETGLVVPPDPRHLAQAMERLTSDLELRTRLIDEGLRWSATFTFDRAAEVVLDELARLSAA